MTVSPLENVNDIQRRREHVIVYGVFRKRIGRGNSVVAITGRIFATIMFSLISSCRVGKKRHRGREEGKSGEILPGKSEERGI